MDTVQNGHGELRCVVLRHIGQVSLLAKIFRIQIFKSDTGWFKGLSQNFLQVRTARLLVLAGADRLDRDLMIGQMQGKFQLEVIAGVGHHLQEDDPTRLAELLVEFWRRNERPAVRGVKKVGEL